MRCEECFDVTGVKCEVSRMAGRAGLVMLDAGNFDTDLHAEAEDQVLEKVSDTILGLGCRLGREVLKTQILNEPGPM